MEQTKAYYVVIPAKVRYDDNLAANAKLLYGDIAALANEKGYCWATNDYFAKLYKVSTKSISTWVKGLCDAGHIKLEILHKKDGALGTVRLLKIVESFFVNEGQKSSYPPEEKVDTPRRKLPDPHEENFTHNNTLNTTINKSLSQISKKSSDKKNFDKDSDPYLLAKLLEHEILKNNPKFPENEKQKQNWAKDIDLMIRRDNISADDIAEVIVWCQQDAFWRSNILSGKKLREKYQQLRMKMKNQFD